MGGQIWGEGAGRDGKGFGGWGGAWGGGGGGDARCQKSEGLGILVVFGPHGNPGDGNAADASRAEILPYSRAKEWGSSTGKRGGQIDGGRGKGGGGVRRGKARWKLPRATTHLPPPPPPPPKKKAPNPKARS